MQLPLSLLDLAPIAEGASVAQSFADSVALAQAAETFGYERVWYAEHHNVASIASSATSVLIGHVAGKTSTIRVGSGGIMLPNHAPLTIAEQFGTLEALYPGRIDLGVGRAPGSGSATMAALRRDVHAADRFPDEIAELRGFLSGDSLVSGVQATPGAGARVPIYMLGSSLFGARVAAALGLPYAFASHFAPAALHEAVSIYRREFTPSEQLAEPYVIAGVNVVAADTTEVAREQAAISRRRRVRGLIRLESTGPAYTDDQIDLFLTTPAGQQLASMMTYSAIGTADEVGAYLESFAATAQADELIIVPLSPEVDGRIRSIELTAAALA